MPIEQTHPPLTITKQIEADPIRRALAAFYKAGGSVPAEVTPDPIAGRLATKAGKPPMATSNSPTFGQSNSPRQKATFSWMTLPGGASATALGGCKPTGGRGTQSRRQGAASRRRAGCLFVQVGWGNLRWPQVGEFGWPSGANQRKTAPSPRLMNFVVVHAVAAILAPFKIRQVKDHLMIRRMIKLHNNLVRLKGSFLSCVGIFVGL